MVVLMKTPTHALIGYAAARYFGFSRGQTILCVVGATAPDLPLALIWSYVAAGVTLERGVFDQPSIQAVFDPIYFGTGWTSGLHNLLHSPLSLLILTLATLALPGVWRALKRPILIFFLGAWTHSLVDILTHVHDGPLLLWPLDHTLRVPGLVSHWDPALGGHWVMAAECACWIASLALVLKRRFKTVNPAAQSIRRTWHTVGDTVHLQWSKAPCRPSRPLSTM